MLPSEHDRARIAAAVAHAERTTSGEIVVVLANDVSEYRETPLVWASGAALIAPALAVWLGAKPLVLAQQTGGWTAVHMAALDQTIAWAIGAYALAQVVIFTLVYALVSVKPVRRALTLPAMKRQRAHKAAVAQFLATGLDGSPERTGVLIFAALDDHVVEIIADAAIHAKVGQGAWKETIEAMQGALKQGDIGAAFERGVALCGAALATHFPAGAGDGNSMPDAPRVI